MNTAYTWHLLVMINKDKEYSVLRDMPLPFSQADNNFFRKKEDAIKWLQERKDEDDLFCDGDTLVLTEMYFT